MATLTFALGYLIAALACGTASAAIYWTEKGEVGEQNVGRANLDGTNADPEFIVGSRGEASNSATCDGIALDGSYMYWAANASGTIDRANVNGSEVDQRFVSGISHPCDVTLDSHYLYWTSDDFEAGHWIGRANLDGSGVEPEFLETGRNPCALTTYESNLLGRSFKRERESGIYETPSDGGGPTSALFPEVEAGCGIAISGQFVYWTDFNGFIGRAMLDGSLVEPHFIKALTPPCGLAIFGGALYWTEAMLPPTMGEISSANLDGSGLRRGILTGLVQPCGIAVDRRLVPTKALPPPPAIVRSGPIRHNPITGTIRVAVDVSRPGTLSLLTTRQQFTATVLGGSDQVGPGRSWVRVSARPGPRSTWPRNAMRHGRGVEVTLRLDFKPTVGSVVAKSWSLTMRRKVGSGHG